MNPKFNYGKDESVEIIHRSKDTGRGSKPSKKKDKSKKLASLEATLKDIIETIKPHV
jgi:hypothetical protein